MSSQYHPANLDEAGLETLRGLESDIGADALSLEAHDRCDCCPDAGGDEEDCCDVDFGACCPTGVTAALPTAQAPPADLSDEQVARLKEVEQRLGVVIVAYDQA